MKKLLFAVLIFSACKKEPVIPTKYDSKLHITITTTNIYGPQTWKYNQNDYGKLDSIKELSVDLFGNYIIKGFGSAVFVCDTSNMVTGGFDAANMDITNCSINFEKWHFYGNVPNNKNKITIAFKNDTLFQIWYNTFTKDTSIQKYYTNQ